MAGEPVLVGVGRWWVQAFAERGEGFAPEEVSGRIGGGNRGAQMIGVQISLLEWTISAGRKLSEDHRRDYGMHLHGDCEETFLIKSSSLEFAIARQSSIVA